MQTSALEIFMAQMFVSSHTFFSSLSNRANAVIIIGGDFNPVINPKLDRLNSPGNIWNWQSTATLKQYMSGFGLGKLSFP